MNANWSRNAFVYLLIIVAAAALFMNIYQPGETPEQITLSQLAKAVGKGNVGVISGARRRGARHHAGQRRHL